VECLSLAGFSSLGKDKTQPWNGVPEKCSTWLGSGLTLKHETRLKRLARDKHSSLFGTLNKLHVYNVCPRSTEKPQEGL